MMGGNRWGVICSTTSACMGSAILMRGIRFKTIAKKVITNKRILYSVVLIIRHDPNTSNMSERLCMEEIIHTHCMHPHAENTKNKQNVVWLMIGIRELGLANYDDRSRNTEEPARPCRRPCRRRSPSRRPCPRTGGRLHRTALPWSPLSRSLTYPIPLSATIPPFRPSSPVGARAEQRSPHGPPGWLACTATSEASVWPLPYDPWVRAAVRWAHPDPSSSSPGGGRRGGAESSRDDDKKMTTV